MQGRWNQTKWKAALYLNRISLWLVLLPIILMRLGCLRIICILSCLVPMTLATVAFFIFIRLPAGARANYNRQAKRGHDIHTSLEGISSAAFLFLVIQFFGGLQLFLLLKFT